MLIHPATGLDSSYDMRHANIMTGGELKLKNFILTRTGKPKTIFESYVDPIIKLN